jgi:myo-inositol-1(or 4)-monophosphatase
VNVDAPQLLAAAQLAADRAAVFLRRQEGRLAPDAWSEKGHGDFVTEVDREAERLVAESLLARAPGSVVVGEELSPGASVSGLAWLVDPLDGTSNFLHRYPCYAVSIAAVVDADPVVGVVHHVSAGIRYHAVAGGGAYQDGTPIHASSRTDPRHALVGTGFPFRYADLLPRYQAQFAAVLAGAGGVRRTGSAALDLCDVAAGRFDGFWELVLSPWDVAAGALLVREAGGRITDLDGASTVIRHGPIVAGNPQIHAWLLELLRRAEPSA